MERRKLYYVPGLISLLVLPIVLLIFSPEEKERQTSLRLFIPTDEKPDGITTKYSRYTVFEEAQKKKIVQVAFWYSPYGDEIGLYGYNAKLRFIHTEIERLAFTNDTTSVLKIKLGDGISYGDFVWILNELLICRVNRYALVDNSFYVFANPPPSPPQTLELETLEPLVSDVVAPEDDNPVPGKWQVFKWQLEEQWEIMVNVAKCNWLLISGFIVLIVIPALIKRRRPFHAVSP